MASNINMKKILFCFLIGLLFVGVFLEVPFNTKKDSAETANEEEDTAILPRVKGKVVEIYENYLIVELAGNNMVYEASTNNLECVEDFQKGDIVRITYSGNTHESMPGILVGVTNIEVEEAEECE